MPRASPDVDARVTAPRRRTHADLSHALTPSRRRGVDPKEGEILTQTNEQADVVVIGGGLAGLVAANVHADEGSIVVVIETKRSVGGRATTDTRSAMLFNQGPRALYLDGEGLATLRTMGVDPPGAAPVSEGALGVDGNRVDRFPISAASLARTSLLTARGKAEFAVITRRLPGVDAQSLSALSAEDWIRTTIRSDRVRALVRSVMRVATYVADLHRLSADVGVRQLQMAIGGVRYVDGGWQSIADTLAGRATRRGVRIVTGQQAAPIEWHRSGWRVRTGTTCVTTRQVLLAGLAPSAAARLADSDDLRRTAADATQATAATLDIGLRELPDPDRRFAMGIDRPFYYSVHSPPARLGDGVVLHVMKYLSADDRAAGPELRDQMRTFLDTVQPGWQDRLVMERFLRRMTVTHTIPTPETGGADGRHPHAVADRPGVFVSGDWVGPIGHLADAAIASAAKTARLMRAATVR